MVDPRNPGCVDEILHLGDYWDTEGMEKNKQEILKYNKEVGRHFVRAYKYLAAAKEVMDDIEEVHTRAVNYGKLNILADKLAKELVGSMKVAAYPGKERHLFGSAYTPGGFVDYSDTVLNKVERVCYIDGKPGTGKTTLMNKLATYAVDRGLYVEYFHAPLKPHKLDSIVIKGMGLAVTCSPKGKEYADSVVDLNECLDKDIINECEALAQKDNEIFELLIEEAFSSILAAKTVHDKLETYYIPNMDFTKIDVLRERTIERILEYC